jgi:hypothetical protein
VKVFVAKVVNKKLDLIIPSSYPDPVEEEASSLKNGKINSVINYTKCLLPILKILIFKSSKNAIHIINERNYPGPVTSDSYLV